ncbi:Myb-like DNA-binding domain containing protein [Trichomonas vaginalis G3]|uniref:Myb-like DNA-binding domain containing protein n=1 Tax=Trichomonas vaginalis (strain ATCC PRA-98 / G3) TaxID=412133 RepID=A2DUL9_TRIV3|nr:RNA polymerase II transcription regulator recruiting protein [Trichomonas vaginalis G3]EAY15910.1 Myb-like DNA-binding domain containing protein [Trichomonas vaginalis G3]KAI5506629.1 RNA polymerase II transcription regulator recruiting protein [Trichomonas vaginalis G3]|eukprot:XP_001328133.1 Myb-like DNA-binding domain containing protein [Trichomonas vaginalis G3]
MSPRYSYSSSSSDSDDASYTSSPATTGKYGKRFTKEEDALLKELAKDKKNRTWKEIATFLPGRTACQCRDRYNQYLFKEVVSKPWTSEEDEVIVEKYRLYGPHWVKISQFLPGRSGNNIKNRWNSALTKYHGIQHKNARQERRSKKDKWIDDASYEQSPVIEMKAVAEEVSIPRNDYKSEKIILPVNHNNNIDNNAQSLVKMETLDDNSFFSLFSENYIINDFEAFDLPESTWF